VPATLKDHLLARSSIQVQAFVLMSAQGAYTDWHADMGGSSVFYHLQTGWRAEL